MPDKYWEWVDIWHIEKNDEFTDDNGWQYAVDFKSNYHKSSGLLDVVRKRKWVRICKKKVVIND